MAKSQDKGEALRKRVQNLFSKALPFDIKMTPGLQDKKEKVQYLTPKKNLFSKIDVTIQKENEVFLVIECKHIANRQKFLEIADRLKRIKESEGAKAGLIVIRGIKIPKKDIEEIKESHDLHIWDEDLLFYYEKVASTLGLFSFFEIAYALGIKLEENSGDEFRPAIYFKQEIGGHTLEAVSFRATPKDMIRRAFVFRHANKQAQSYQRLLNRDKLNKIAEYLEHGSGNIINSILVLLPAECKFKSSKLIKEEEDAWYYTDKSFGKINLPNKFCFIEVIDGQHRLFSFTKCHDDKLREKTPLNFIGIIGGEKELARDLFITINQKAKKIEANLLASIQKEYDKENLSEPDCLAREIVRELNKNKKSELFDSILEGEKVTPHHQKLRIYIAMLAYNGVKRLIKKEGPLKVVLKKKTVPPYFKAINLFLKRVKVVFPEDYLDNNKYFVFTNNGLIPLLRIFGDMCKFYKKVPSNPQIDEVLKLIKDSNWTSEYIKSRVSGAGWKKTYDELIDVIKNDTRFKNFPD